MSRLIQLDHSEIVTAVQRAMGAQLFRDGKVIPGMELGLTFYAAAADTVRVEGSVCHHGQFLFGMAGSPANLCSIATDLALSKLAKGESRRYQPAATVRWRIVRFSGDEGSIDRFMVDVEFQEREAISA